MMHAWEQIQKTVDYIEERLSEEIKIETLANLTGLSPFYFQRLFKRLVKKPVNKYVKLRRLARASEVLLDKNKRIVDIALDYGFSSHETFTRSFKDAYRITPAEFRSRPSRLTHVSKPDLFLDYTMIDEDVPLITDSMVLEMTRRKLDSAEAYVGLSTKIPISQMPAGETTGIDRAGQLWDSFHSCKDDIPYLLSDGIELGVSMMGEAMSDTFTYFVGGEMMSNTFVCEPFVKWELTAGEYVVCCFEAENFSELSTNALGKAMNYLVETWLVKRGLTIQPFSVEKYYQTTSSAAYMEIWIVPVSIKDTP